MKILEAFHNSARVVSINPELDRFFKIISADNNIKRDLISEWSECTKIVNDLLEDFISNNDLKKMTISRPLHREYRYCISGALVNDLYDTYGRKPRILRFGG